MKRLLILLSLCFLCNKYVFSWNGTWESGETPGRNFFSQIPFHSEYLDDTIIIHNEKPNKTICYEIIDEDGSALISGCVSMENSAQIIISISELPANRVYTIVLRSPYPEDMVYSQFSK